jgi:hypothetical protein
LLSPLTERHNEMFVWGVWVINVSPKRECFIADLPRGGMFRSVSAAPGVRPILLAKDLSNVRSDYVDNRFRVWLMKAVFVRPSGNFMSVDKAVIVNLSSITLYVALHRFRIG